MGDDRPETPSERDERLWLERYERQKRLIYPERYAPTSKYIPHVGAAEKTRNLKRLKREGDGV